MLRNAEAMVARFPIIASPRRHDLPHPLVVSLTSYPPRYPTLAKTLKSLLDQTVTPDRIILWLADDDRASLPHDVIALTARGLEICVCANLRSYKKLIPALQRHPDAAIVTADDDVHYPPQWLESLVALAQNHPAAVIAHRCHLASLNADGSLRGYREWTMATRAKVDTDDGLLFPTGVGGILYPPRSLDRRVQDIAGFLALCPRADDVWFFWMTRLAGTLVRAVGTPWPPVAWDGSQDEALFHDNWLGSGNDEQIRAMEGQFGVIKSNRLTQPLQQGRSPHEMPTALTGPSIAFIVPTFNRAQFLAEALAAILVQMREQDELLVVDDGSTDNTADIVAAAGPRAKYLRQANSGKAVALNRGLAATTAPLVWICDDDDLLRMGAVDLLVNAMSDDKFGFAFGRYTRFREHPDGSREDLGTGYWPDLSHGLLARHILDDGFVMQNAALVRRTAYDAVGPFSESMPRSLDYEMFVRLAVSFPATYVDRILFDQRKHDGARGPAAMMHKVERSDEVWQRYDRFIFLNLYHHAPLSYFSAMQDGGSDSVRAGLLRRASIMMRHGCWIESVADLEAAISLPFSEWDEGETVICRNMLVGKHGFGGLLQDAEAMQRLKALARTTAGTIMIRAMISGTLWRLRHSGSDRNATLALLRALVGWKDAAALVLTKVRPARKAAKIRDRKDLPAGEWLPPRLVPPVLLAAQA